MNKNLLKFDNEDNYENYNDFNNQINAIVESEKIQYVRNIEYFGSKYLNEIDNKNKKNNNKKKKLISYILKYESDKYDYDELNSYSYYDVLKIYNETKEEHKCFFIKILKFLFFSNKI